MNLFIEKLKCRCIKILIITLVFISTASSAQNAGTLDLSFGGTGFVTNSLGTSHSFAYAMALQSDSKIITAGYSIQNGYAAITLVRYLPNGSMDNSFGTNGIVITQTGLSSHATSIALQNDNKIVATGITSIDTSFYFTAIRYNPDGTLDNAFGNGGIVFINVENSSNSYNVALKSNEKIVISGYSNRNSNTGIALVQLNTDGTTDTSFGTGGISIHHFTESPDVEAWAMALDSNDKIVTAGMIYDVGLLRNKIAICRFNADGSLDTSFGIGGITNTSMGVNSDDFGNAVTIQTDNKIVIAGTSDNTAVIARYTMNGTLDSLFGTGGIISTNFENNEPAEAYGITVQNDGKVVAVGVSGSNAMNTNGNFGLFRLNPDGTFDNTFGTNGKVITDISNGKNDVAFSVKELPDAMLVVSGISMGATYGFAVARYNGTSVQIPENSMNENVIFFPNPAIDNIEIIGINHGVIEIINLQGQVIKSLNISDIKSSMDLSELSAGVYTMRVKTNNKLFMKKLIKQ